MMMQYWMKLAQFLSNSVNKQWFVDHHVSKLEAVQGVECIQAEHDADTLIIDTPNSQHTRR